MELFDRDLLRHLINLAEKLDIQVRFEKVGDEEISSKGGHCRLKNQRLLIVDNRLSLPEKIRLFIDALRQQDLEGLYVPPLIRRMIEGEEKHMTEE
ncbi:MAG: hypothetical protein JRG73_07300 [Deltaproteobacteria bacterium]|nr:hypothetical protein [Deltaproteobacteria bacterium]MBW2306731.1 hypothetical protein [Deltaproteobacteria bacterium]